MNKINKYGGMTGYWDHTWGLIELENRIDKLDYRKLKGHYYFIEI